MSKLLSMDNPHPVIELSYDNTITYMNGAAKLEFPTVDKMLVLFSDIEDELSELKYTPKVFNRELQVGDKWFLETVSSVPSDEGFKVFLFDITHQKEKEYLLKDEVYEQNEIIAAVAETVPVGLWKLDKTGNVLYGNNAFLTMLGMSPEELSEQDFFTLFHENDQDIVKRNLLNSINGESGKFEVRYYRKTLNGWEIRWCEVGYKPIVNGVYRGTVGVFSDTTSIKEIIPQIKALRDQCKQLKNKEK